MTRAYYTDPLAAAWMEKHFDVRLHVMYKDGTLGSPLTGCADCWSPPYYIHPDSLFLLQARAGDLIVEDDKPYFITAFAGIPIIDMPIIQRNGIPFHWPQFEE